MPIWDERLEHDLLLHVGRRLCSLRLQRNMTQAELAREARVAKRTIERLESGQTATRLSGFFLVCRALGLLERLDGFLSAGVPLSPNERSQDAPHRRRRAASNGLKLGGSENDIRRVRSRRR